jgi:anaerobic selenocysteine-containing dehydrogenase
MIDDMDYVFDLYRPIPHWLESSESSRSEGYDLWAINWKTPYYANDASNLTGNPWLAEIYAKDPWESVILPNPITASKKELKDGDRDRGIEIRQDRRSPQGIGAVSP